ncbi:hypothetical protein V3391_06625 [Luteimonas sp. SMYT11W]|uniref:Uncharacterized protein n=1 Tax=Luteimonas flava TaxID=3115822 RepID=A0ABU7WD59_9GAMM
MSARPMTTQRVHDAVRVCAPITVHAIIQALAKDDEHAAREIRRCVSELLKRDEIAVTGKPGRADRRVLIAVQNPAPAPLPPPVESIEPAAAPVRAVERARLGKYRPPMPRERAPHLIPAPALQPQWPAVHKTGAVLAPRITGGFIHG